MPILAAAAFQAAFHRLSGDPLAKLLILCRSQAEACATILPNPTVRNETPAAPFSDFECAKGRLESRLRPGLAAPQSEMGWRKDGYVSVNLS
jgi:hypothetical protein